MDTLSAIKSRRSTSRLVAPGPMAADLDQIMEAAAWAPDHGELRPFRFALLEGEAKTTFGKVLERAYLLRCSDGGAAPIPAKAEKERTKLGRAPLVVVAGAVQGPPGPIPWTEQLAAVAVACQNILLAATALGYGSKWRTGEAAYDATVKRALGLGPDDAIAGFLYLGTVPADAATRQSRVVDWPSLVSRWEETPV